MFVLHSRRRSVSIASLLSLVPFGALAVACSKQPPPKPEQAAPAEAAVHVTTAVAKEVQAPRSLTLTGSLRGSLETELAANANGRVLQTFVERGDEVKKDAVLATLDTRTASLSASQAKTATDIARAQAEVATRECERAAKLFNTGAISQADYDRTRDQCTTAPLAVASSETQARLSSVAVADGVVRAPFAGTITERFVDPGRYVRADSRVVSLVVVDPLRLEIAVPEAYIPELKTSDTVSFTVAAYPDRVFTGTVRYVGASVRGATRDVIAEAVVANADRALKPGMFAAVKLATGTAPATSVPKDAVVTREGSPRAFVAVDGRAEERVVQVGVAIGGDVPVLRGVKTGENVIVSPPASLKNGQAVN